MNERQVITREMVDSAMNEMRDGGVQRWCDKYLGEIEANEPIEAFENFHAHALLMAMAGADPITTATASFVAGFEVARRFFNAPGS